MDEPTCPQVDGEYVSAYKRNQIVQFEADLAELRARDNRLQTALAEAEQHLHEATVCIERAGRALALIRAVRHPTTENHPRVPPSDLVDQQPGC